MKKLFFSLLFLVQASLLSAERPLSYREAIETNPALAELLIHFGVSSEEPPAEVKRAVRELWMQVGKERWEFDARYEEEKELLWPLFAELHLLEPISAQKNRYDYALVHGALLTTVEKRLNFLIAEWNRGVRFSQLVFLTGRRRLLPSEQEKVGASFETEMVKWVYEKVDMPPEMRSLPVTFTDTTGPWGHRPCTEDTVRDWLSQKSLPGSCLIVSSQPYIGYQGGVAKRLFPDPFTIEAIGPGVSSDLKVSLFLDTLAKWLAQMS